MQALRTALAAILFLTACHGAPPPSAGSCDVGDGPPLDVAGRADGVYGAEGDRLGATPLARFEQLARTSRGVFEESAKPWIGIRLDDDASRELQAFTSKPEGRSIVVVVDGRVASRHKIRAPIVAHDLQLSCCNPKACERWNAILRDAP